MGVDQVAVARETANKLNKLFIARRDVKAVQRSVADGGEWFASKKPFTLDDFQKHLFTKGGCLGTYLLDLNSQVKFVAFDIDLSGSGPYFIIKDLPESEAEYAEMEAEYAQQAVGEMDLDYRSGPWEETLHDPDNDGYRWVRSHLRVLIETLCDKVEDQLDLPAVPVITGGGAHVLVPFGQRVDAAIARAAAHGVMETVGGFQRSSENFYSNAPDLDNRDEKKKPVGETITIEVFPKQDTLPSPDSFGNLIRLPFGWHDEAQIRTYIMKREPGLLPPWELPKEPGMPALDAVMARLGMTVEARD